MTRKHFTLGEWKTLSLHHIQSMIRELKMIDKRLIIKSLPASCVIRNFVKGVKECNYELYLVELLNQSTWFKRNFNEHFKYKSVQDAGQCDAYAGEFGIDFKLVASKTELQGKSLFSPQIMQPLEGITLYGPCKKLGGEIKATNIYAAIRNKTIEELKDIKAASSKKQGFENDIQECLETFETCKNVLFFFPYCIDIDNCYDFQEVADAAEQALNSDFKGVIAYREEFAPNFEDYFVTICKSEFAIFSIHNGVLKLVDHVPISKIDTFVKLKEYNSMF